MDPWCRPSSHQQTRATCAGSAAKPFGNASPRRQGLPGAKEGGSRRHGSPAWRQEEDRDPEA
eukprot:11946590-Alexandrium_andersonii.AAC.1